jgi:hypothetical protein
MGLNVRRVNGLKKFLPKTYFCPLILWVATGQYDTAVRQDSVFCRT